MEHLLLKAVATTTTDLGEFEAVISTSAIDREGDIVEPAAMVDALQAWNRPIPLDWNHSTNPEDIVGHVHPESVKAVGGEVQASGQVDLDTDRGRHVWRLMKTGTLGFSFGYLIPGGGSFKRADGGRTITALDVFAVTTTPSPMNNGTRVLATKAIEDDDDGTPTHAELERELIQLGIITAPASAEQYRQADPVLTGHGPNGHSETKAIDPRIADEVRAINAVFDSATKALDADRKSLATKSTVVPERSDPIQTASFDC